MLVSCGHCGQEIFVLHRRGGQSTATCKWCQAELLVSPDGHVEVLNVPEGAPPPSPKPPPAPVDASKPTERDLEVGTAMVTPEGGIPSLPPPVPPEALEERRSEFLGPLESEATWLTSPAMQMLAAEKSDAGVVEHIYGPLPTFDDGLAYNLDDEDGDEEEGEKEGGEEAAGEDEPGEEQHLRGDHEVEEATPAVEISPDIEQPVAKSVDYSPTEDADPWARPNRSVAQDVQVDVPAYEESDTEKVEVNDETLHALDLEAKTERMAPHVPDLNIDAETERVAPRTPEINLDAETERVAPRVPEFNLDAETERVEPLVPEVGPAPEPEDSKAISAAAPEPDPPGVVASEPEPAPKRVIALHPGLLDNSHEEVAPLPSEPESPLDVETDRVEPHDPDPDLDVETDRVSPRPPESKRERAARNARERGDLLDLPAPPGIHSSKRRRDGRPGGRPTDKAQGISRSARVGVGVTLLLVLGVLVAWATGLFRGGQPAPEEPWVRVAEDAVGAQKAPAPPPPVERQEPPPAPPLEPEIIPTTRSQRARPKDSGQNPRRKGKRRRARQER